MPLREGTLAYKRGILLVIIHDVLLKEPVTEYYDDYRQHP